MDVFLYFVLFVIFAWGAMSFACAVSDLIQRKSLERKRKK